MSDKAPLKTPLIIPFASSTEPQAREAMRKLELPNLAKLLARLTPAPLDSGEKTSFSTPLERAIARLHGLPAEDGQIPWAALHMQQTGRDPGEHAWTFITPCHWQVGTTSASMTDPQVLALTEAEAQILLEAMRPYFNEDGIELVYDEPGRWLARSELFRGLPTASLDRVTGQGIDDWMPKTAQAKPLRRLQNEMQMLLYTHPLNDERAARGLPPVNSFWAHGTGALPAGHGTQGPSFTVAQELREPALQGDWAAWAEAWRRIDTEDCARLLAQLEQSGSASLILCGERNAQTFDATPVNFLGRLGRLFRRPQPAAILETL